MSAESRSIAHALEVATTKTIKIRGGDRSKVTFTNLCLELAELGVSRRMPPGEDSPPRRCITDSRRSRRLLYIRLQTWLSRFVWEAFHDGRELETRLLHGELHYIAHLRSKRSRPCWLCPPEIRERFLEVKPWENINTKTTAR